MKEIGKVLLVVLGVLLIVMGGVWFLTGELKNQIRKQNEELIEFQEERLVFRDSIEEALEHGMYSLVAD